ncbi:GNAT family N-acetyltransferase [Pedobacter cryoconitis]|uniref:RimJ/RimL family protein N-acetyltransferase n=1 Tax=Pedobacter cryoconitis TaxID=188932 RepID=A0A327T6N2_9SPHI|nr:GNAT family N-acetyltransferase [Pedobacter cryoconitis]RAJ33467.1 RimJ/RimL family protein N-acetyltransferase [Pedobacter cryoconitis]
MNKDVFIEGDRIFLRALKEQDVEGNYSLWLNDPEITYFNSHGRFPMTADKLLKYVSHINSSQTDFVLAVIDKQTSMHIGNISLQNVSWIDRNAEIAFLLGDKTFWGKGIMEEAAILILKHGFRILNLHRIYCGTSAENLGMQKLAKKIGMIQEGLRRDAIFKQGKYIDIMEFGILSNEI